VAGDAVRKALFAAGGIAVGALAYWTAEAIKNRYVKNPAPLVPA